MTTTVPVPVQPVILCGSSGILLTENQSTYIPLEEVHRLSNPGTIPLEIIEVQTGSYLREDEIVPFEDRYGRSEKWASNQKSTLPVSVR